MAQIMFHTSICGLGQVASNPVMSILKYFPHLIPRPGVGSARGGT
ncbi:MAG TPA: NADH-ubiquinone oxidoreductase-F iron-sulfur binding region domain-containing protein [Pirellulaceae bacterium]